MKRANDRDRRGRIATGRRSRSMMITEPLSEEISCTRFYENENKSRKAGRSNIVILVTETGLWILMTIVFLCNGLFFHISILVENFHIPKFFAATRRFFHTKFTVINMIIYYCF